MTITESYLKHLVYRVNGAAIEVHKSLGLGLLESVYHKCVEYEFIERGISYQSELIVPVTYKNARIKTELRCDFFVEGILPVEIKSTEGIHPNHEAQLLTYMKLLSVPEGLLIYFNVVNVFSEGQKTFVNDLYRGLPDK